MGGLNAVSAEELAQAVVAGNRRALAKTITFIESTRDDHRHFAEDVLRLLLPYTGKGIRVGISGVPGVGKSTFIESFGLHVVNEKHRIAVLAIDPSSPRTGGSILGDKTRMEMLSRCPDAFIRPSPSGGTLGGVARRTREAMLACEAAGFDVVLIETVGVGQSETAVADMTDMFLLLLVPGGGDELQGIKKGIVELADAIVVNKADGDLKAAADRAMREYKSALHLLRPASERWSPPVLRCSALNNVGIDNVWNTVSDYRKIMTETGEIAARRSQQAVAWMWSDVRDNLLSMFRTHPAVTVKLEMLEHEVADGRQTPMAAARVLLESFLQDK